MDKIRKPFQGTWNIIRFNWHFYVLSLAFVTVFFSLNNSINGALHALVAILIIIIITSTVVSLLVSAYVYDFSNLYKLTWLDKLKFSCGSKIVNINAGFDETSVLLKTKFATSGLLVFDFYDSLKHTEISIKRARKAYEPFPRTQHIMTKDLPLSENSADKIFAIFSAHEIRDYNERVFFFKELCRVLMPSGQIIITEHLRDTLNFLAYNIGFFHFYSRANWIKTFRLSNLKVVNEIKITPFVTTFILEKNGAAS